jgi:hypothetical protein
MRTTTTRVPTTRVPLVVAVTFTAAAAVSCAKVEADVPQAEVTQRAIAFQGLPGGSQLGEVSVTQSFTLTSDDLSWAKDLNSEVYAYEVELKAVGAVQDLSFIHYAHITMADGSDGATTSPVEIVNYERPENASPSPVIDAKTLYPINVSEVWAAKKVVITMVLAGVFPEVAWSADVTVHMSGKISYKF